jgi:hypothetical protein
MTPVFKFYCWLLDSITQWIKFSVFLLLFVYVVVHLSDLPSPFNTTAFPSMFVWLPLYVVRLWTCRVTVTFADALLGTTTSITG